jgi:CRP/FNR family transcriptional regulator, cyclic AMP receptor protein
MRSPYGFEVLERCLTCSWRGESFFCNLPDQALRSFESLKFTTAYPAGAILFNEGEEPRGIFMLCKGRVKLSTGSSDGRTLIIRIVEAGEVLGLSGTISGRPYKTTAETIEPSQINFVKRDDFQRFLRENGDACYHAAAQLAHEGHIAHDTIRSLGLSHSATEKLAKLILSWADENGKETPQGVRVKLLSTHQDIAQMIGTSRETVTRLLSELKNRRVISLKGSTLFVLNRDALEALVLL